MAKLMSDRLKEALSHELDVHHIVEEDGWGGVSARNCGNLVKLALQRAEESLQTEEERRH